MSAGVSLFILFVIFLSVGLWNCSDIVVLFVFHCVTMISIIIRHIVSYRAEMHSGRLLLFSMISIEIWHTVSNRAMMHPNMAHGIT